jgi:hypothetical protein
MMKVSLLLVILYSIQGRKSPKDDVLRWVAKPRSNWNAIMLLLICNCKCPESIVKPSDNMTEYTNRYGDVFTFTKQEDGNVLWEGNFEFHRYGWPNNPDGTSNYDIIDVVDPSGGPYIKAGQMLSHIVYGDDLNVIVESFERIDTGYIIKCKEHKYDPNDFSHLADTKIIGGIINTTEV